MAWKIRELHIMQLEDMTLTEAVLMLEEKFKKSERNVKKNIYHYSDYCLSYDVPIFESEITIYPVEKSFINKFLPQEYSNEEFPQHKREILHMCAARGDIGTRATFILEMPDTLSKKKNEHLVKLFGMSTGGYFSTLTNLPSHGMLNKEDNIYIERHWQQYHSYVFNNLENILNEYSY